MKFGLPTWILAALTAIGGLFSFNNDCLADQKPKSVTVATWNLEWFYDHNDADNSKGISKDKTAPGREQWQWKKNSVAAVIAALQPTILCLQEVENRQVIYELIKQLRDQYDIRYRYAFIPGYDFGTDQDVAIIYRSGLVEYSRREQSKEMFDSKEFYNLSKHLIARFEWGSGNEKESLMILNVHLRARPERADLRIRQSKLIRAWIDDSVRRGDNVIVTGDFNVEEDFGTETKMGAVGIIRGLATETEEDDLADAHSSLSVDQRSTHLSGRQYDRIFFSHALRVDDSNINDLVFNRALVRRDLVVQGEIDGENHWDRFYEIADNQRDISDHYPLIAEFLFI